jgi:hypothetical protein
MSKQARLEAQAAKAREHYAAAQELRDRAVEWVNEHYPDLHGAAYNAAIADAIADLKRIDAEAEAFA